VTKEKHMKFLFTVMGVMLVVEGIPWFLSPPTIKKTLRQLISLPDATLRLLGAALMFGGLSVVYLAMG